MKAICSNCEAENDANSKYCSVCGFKLPIHENENTVPEIKKQQSDKPSRKFNLKTILGFVVGFAIMFFLMQFLLNPSSDASVDKALVEAANEINKNCPMNVDQNTTLKNAVALPDKTFQYNYVLVGITKANVKIDTVRKYIFPRILEEVKNNPQLKSFRDNKITIKYNYTDANGQFVTEYVVKPEMYEK
ncbi:zinc-ribbon domain-containing protein [Flavobacterium sp. FlaQc-57]|uniref:zinc-ribbon domain-containing protein n=1 Tax=Flavobacterium sp. FlaQc-57 TaxID=3374186 RepID=UPI0037563570